MRGYFNFCRKIWPIFAFTLAVDLIRLIIVIVWRVPAPGMPSVTLMIAFVFCAMFAIGPELFDPRLQTQEPELSERCRHFAEVANVEALPVLTVNPRALRKSKVGLVKDNKIFLTKALRKTFSPEMVDFVLAHEVAHLVRLKSYREAQKAPPRWLLFVFVPLLMVFLVAISFVYPFRPVILAITAVSFACLIPFYVALGLAAKAAPTHATPELELWCDKFAVELTGNPAAAEEALRAMCAGSTDRRSKMNGYPTLQQRLDQVQSLAIPAEPSA